MIEVPPDADGRVDQAALKELLQAHSGAARKIGSFSAASNVTGILEDVDGITQLLHQHNALAFWDYAAAGPHCKSGCQAEVLPHLQSSFLPSPPPPPPPQST